MIKRIFDNSIFFLATGMMASGIIDLYYQRSYYVGLVKGLMLGAYFMLYALKIISRHDAKLESKTSGG